MGTVIEFPAHGSAERVGGYGGVRLEPATVIILPVIRIERYADEPAERTATRSQRRRRRRRTSRSKASA
ncbi:MAG: hypothetical protein ACRECO_15960 [Xanthobacteraceae bacterium]